MKILVIDDAQRAHLERIGTLVCLTLKRLGHEAVLSLDPSDITGALTDDIEAVITDIELNTSSGVELARAIRTHNPHIPIAFCTANSPAPSLRAEASSVGPILCAPWTLSDMKALCTRIEDGSLLPAARELHIDFPTWIDVGELCDQAANGPIIRDVHTSTSFESGERAVAWLLLPGGFALSVAATVTEVTTEGDGAALSVTIDGLSSETIARLHALTHLTATQPAEPELSPARPSPAALPIASVQAEPQTSEGDFGDLAFDLVAGEAEAPQAAAAAPAEVCAREEFTGGPVTLSQIDDWDEESAEDWMRAFTRSKATKRDEPWSRAFARANDDQELSQMLIDSMRRKVTRCDSEAVTIEE